MLLSRTRSRISKWLTPKTVKPCAEQVQVILKEHAYLFEQVVLSAKDAIILTEATDLTDGPYIMYVNDAFTEITGYSKEEVIGKSPRMLQGDLTSRKTLDDIRKALESGRAFRGELINYNKSGEAYWLDITIVPLKDASGKITHYAAIERDISDRKETDRSLKDTLVQLKRANLKAEAITKELEESLKVAELANQAKTEFLANMSHELRTPMNGILGLCEMILNSRLDEEQRENAEIIYKSGQNLLSILNDILDISKIEAGEYDIEQVPFDVHMAMKELTQLFLARAEQHGIDLIEESTNVPDVVIGDLGKIQQILRNLVNNALKFTDNGRISLVNKIIGKNGNNYLYFAVKDTGIGIAQDKLEQIFEKFSQADSSVTRKFGGTGLGLAICQKLTFLMGGDIGVESVEGEGSTFWFTVPLQIASEGTKAVNLYDEHAGQQEVVLPKEAKILVVDDHPINRVFASKILTKLGIENITLAKDGKEALEFIEQEDFDLVLMDCQMPEIDGYEATKWVRIMEDQEERKHLPIIAMTANAMVGDRKKCLDAGMDDYLSKPIKADKLTKMLHKWLLGKETAQPDSLYAQQQPVYASVTEVDIEDYIQEVTKSVENEPAMAEPSILMDLEHLRSFTDGDPEEEQMLFHIFDEQSSKHIAELKAAIEHADCEAWRKAAHTMKGASANLGAVRLSELSQEAEHGAIDLTEAEKEEKLQQIKQVFIETKQFLKQVQVAA